MEMHLFLGGGGGENVTYLKFLFALVFVKPTLFYLVSVIFILAELRTQTLQRRLYSISLLLSGCPTPQCKSTAPLHKEWQELGPFLMVTAPSCFQQLPVPLWSQPGALSTVSQWKLRQIKCYLGRVISHRNNTTQGKQAFISDGNQQVWWTLNVPSMHLGEEIFSFTRCESVATTQRACAKGIGVNWDHWWTCEGHNANYRLEPPPFGISVCWFRLAHLQNESCHLDTNPEINDCSCYCSGGTIY